MINCLFCTKSKGMDDILLNILNPHKLDLLKVVSGHSKTVTTAFTQFPLNIHQCDSCLCQVKNPLLIKAVITSYWHFKVVMFGKKRKHNCMD